ncbi:MAG: hypothetical protein KAR06_05525 [Deltaproteobacteria bacterium]|nr:hypothetical protein [Deltaproteobacteria bacterium]
MNNLEEAKAVLGKALEDVKSASFKDLSELMGVNNSKAFDMKGAEGGEYDVEVESIWEEEPEGNLRVNVVVFEKGWTSFVPLSASMLVAPDGEILDEVVGEGL